MKGRVPIGSIAALVLSVAAGGPALAQTAPAPHAQHHPAPAAAPTTPASDQTGPAMPAGMAGMAGMMGEMMKQMGAPPPKEIYQSLMALPDDVTLEQRAAIEQLARERMKSGAAQLSFALERLSDATSRDDYAAMEQATAQMRAGTAEFESGLAARRLLAEGKAPRNLALDWFKREMNLASPIQPDRPRALFGVTLFHLFTMGLLIAFAFAMIAMYFFKMRRAAALFARLGPDGNRPPPGSAPPLAGTPAPSAPVTPPPGVSGASSA